MLQAWCACPRLKRGLVLGQVFELVTAPQGCLRLFFSFPKKNEKTAFYYIFTWRQMCGLLG